MRRSFYLACTLSAFFLTIALASIGQSSSNNKIERQKLMTQLKTAIESIPSNFATYKGPVTMQVPDDLDTSEINVYQSKKMFALASFAAVTNWKESKANELFITFDRFHSDKDAIKFGEDLVAGLKALTYSFGKFVSQASGSESVLELDVNEGKNVPKAFEKLTVMVYVPGDIDNKWHNRVTLRVFKKTW